MCLAPSPTILSTDEVGSVAPPIFTSVGQDAVNGPGDVFVIQSLLNKRLPQPHTDVAVTGIADPGTILAIKAFQAVMMNMNPPSGQVAPGSPTYYALAARPLVNRTSPPPTPFGHIGIVPPEVIEAAKASQRQWGVPASKNAQFAIQPYNVPANVYRFISPSAPLTHSFRWEPGRVSFRTSENAAGKRSQVVAEHVFTSGIPTPGGERVHINLYLSGISQTSQQNGVEVVIEKFAYLP